MDSPNPTPRPGGDPARGEREELRQESGSWSAAREDAERARWREELSREDYPGEQGEPERREERGGEQSGERWRSERSSDIARESRESQEEAKERISRAGQRLKDQGVQAFESYQHRTVDEIGAIGRASHDAAERLRNEGKQNAADWVDYFADGLDRMSSWVRDRDAHRMRADLEHMARQRPGLFVASLFAGGLIAARFLKASRPSDEERQRTAGEERAFIPARSETGIETTPAEPAYAGAGVGEELPRSDGGTDR